MLQLLFPFMGKRCIQERKRHSRDGTVRAFLGQQMPPRTTLVLPGLRGP